MFDSRFTRVAGLLSLLAAACGETTETEHLPPQVELPAAPGTILSFEAAPATVVVGGPTSLHWTTRGVAAIAIADGDGTQLPLDGADVARGSVELRPEETTSYTLTATAAGGGQTWRTVTVTVTEAPPVPPTIEAFTASATVVPAGGEVVLSWRTGGASALVLKDETGAVDLGDAAVAEGQVTVRPTRSPTVYTLVATGPAGGRAHADVSVEVTGLPRVARFFVDPLVPVHVGDPVTLHWEAQNATRVVIRRDGTALVDGAALAGSHELALDDSATFELEATGPGGTATAQVLARVGPRIVSFAADQRVVRTDDPIELSWTLADADRAVIDGPGDFHRAITGAEVASGSATVDVLASGDFVLQAFRGTVPMTAALAIEVTDAPRIRALVVDQPEVTAAHDHPTTVTLSWIQDGAESCTLYRNNVAVPGFQGFTCGATGSADVSIVETGSLRLVATNASGSHAAVAEVVAVPPARIVAFASHPARRLSPGDPVELAWTVTDAAAISMTREGASFPVGATDFTGSAADFAGTGEALYVLTAVNSRNHPTEAQVLVRAGAPEFLSGQAEPDFVSLGERVTLRWTADGGDRLAITDEGGELIFETTDPATIDAGSTTVTVPVVAGTYTYTLTSTNGAGSAVLPIDVVASDGPMIEAFTADRMQISLGEAVTFTWSVRNDAAGVAPTLALADDHGHDHPEIATRPPGAGTLAISPAEEGRHVFRLTATTPGTIPHTRTVVVEVTVPPFLHSFTATPDRVSTLGGTVVPDVVLAWTSANAVRVSLWQADAAGNVVPPAVHRVSLDDGDPQAAIDAGAFTVQPTVTTWYLARATNRVGSTVTALIKVIVDPPEVLAFTATPDQVVEGDTVQLSWTTRNATTVTVDPSVFFVDLAHRPGATQAPLSGDDALTTVPFPAGFTFPFEGTPRTELQVSTNGWAGFDTTNGASNYSSYAFPTSTTYAEVHFGVYWGDLASGSAGQLWYGMAADAQGDYFVVQWKNWTWLSYGSDLNFELVLRPNGSFEYRYGPMSSTTAGREAGAGASIGYQSSTAGPPAGNVVPYAQAVSGGLQGKAFVLPGAAPLPLNGTLAVTPLGTTTFTLTAENADAETTAQTTVTVWKQPQITSLAVVPTAVEATVPFEIRWTTTDATGVRVLDGTGAPICAVTDPAAAASGACTHVEPTGGSRTYTVEAVNGPPGIPLTSTTRPFGFTVFDYLGLDSFTITPDDLFASAGHQVTLAWTATGAMDYQLSACVPNTQTCTDITPANGSPTAGSLAYTVQASTEFRLAVFDSWYRARTGAHVVWIDVPSASLTASRTQITAGEAVDLSWTTSGAERITYPVTAVETTGAAPFIDLAAAGGTVATREGTSTADAGRFVIPFPAGFTFPWFGTAVTGLKASVDGWITFDLADVSTNSTNASFPTSTTYAEVQLAPFWDNLEQVAPGALYWKLEEPVAGPRYLVVQWRNWELNPDSNSELNFEVLLWENGDVEYRYGTMSGSGSYVDDAQGSSATIGFQSPDRTVGLSLSYNAEVPGGLSNRSWRFATGLTPSGTVTVRPGETTTYRVCADNQSLYTACDEVTVVVVRSGDLLFTELMIAPTSDDAEWFELRNVAPYPIDLAGFTIASGLEMYTVPPATPLLVPAGGFAVLARSGEPAVNGGVSPAVVYGSALTLDQTTDDLRLYTGAVLVDGVSWTAAAWTAIAPGASIALEPSQMARATGANDLPSSWCAATESYGTGAFLGSPGALGGGCVTTGALAWYLVDPVSGTPFLDISATGVDDSGILGSGYYTDPIPLGFPLPYFGDVVTTMQIGRHGYVAFTPQGTYYSSNSAIPSATTAPNGFVAAFWDYLYFTTGVAKLHHEQRTVGGRQVMIVQWTAVSPGSTSYGSLDFQLQLWEDGDIALVYRDLRRLNFTYDYLLGSSATFGLESVDGTVAYQVHHGTSNSGGGPIYEGRSYLFRRRPPVAP